MTMQDENFWRITERGMPGMLQLGAGLWGMNRAKREGQQDLNAAQGPEFQRAMQMSQGALANAGSMDPKVAAQERYDAGQGLMAGQNAANEAAMWRQLQSKGLLGLASHDPGKAGALGVNVAPGGQPINPIAAAMYAARDANNRQMAYDSLEQGERQIDRQLGRASGLQNMANSQRQSTLNARGVLPSSARAQSNLLKSAISLGRETGVLKDVGGMLTTGLKGGWDWLKNLGGGGGSDWFSSMSSDSIDW